MALSRESIDRLGRLYTDIPDEEQASKMLAKYNEAKSQYLRTAPIAEVEGATARLAAKLNKLDALTKELKTAIDEQNRIKQVADRVLTAVDAFIEVAKTVRPTPI